MLYLSYVSLKNPCMVLRYNITRKCSPGGYGNVSALLGHIFIVSGKTCAEIHVSKNSLCTEVGNCLRLYAFNSFSYFLNLKPHFRVSVVLCSAFLPDM